MFASRVGKLAAPSVRFFASKSHQAPKTLYGRIGRYASATYVAASKADALEKVENELTAIANTLQKNAGFASYISDPTISRESKAANVNKIFGEDKFSSLTRNLLLTLAGNGRLGDTLKVINSFNELMEASRGVVQATVITAEALKGDNLKSVQAAVGNMVEGKKVEIEYKVDASILGGVQIQVGDRFLDLSVSQRINNINSFLNNA